MVSTGRLDVFSTCYYQRMRVSNYDGAKKLGAPFEGVPEASAVRRHGPKRKKRGAAIFSTNAHKMTTVTYKFPAARIPSDTYIPYSVPSSVVFPMGTTAVYLRKTDRRPRVPYICRVGRCALAALLFCR